MPRKMRLAPDTGSPIARLLALNLNRLMAADPSRWPSSYAVEAATGIGHTTVDAIRKGERDPGLSKVAAIAQAFGLEPWQLLVPELEPSNPPLLAHVSAQQRAMLAKIKEEFSLMVDKVAGQP